MTFLITNKLRYVKFAYFTTRGNPCSHIWFTLTAEYALKQVLWNFSTCWNLNLSNKSFNGLKDLGCSGGWLARCLWSSFSPQAQSAAAHPFNS